MTKEEFIHIVKKGMEQVDQALESKMESLLRSGAVDLENATAFHCTIALKAFLFNEYSRMFGYHPDQRLVKKETENMKIMM